MNQFIFECTCKQNNLHSPRWSTGLCCCALEPWNPFSSEPGQGVFPGVWTPCFRLPSESSVHLEFVCNLFPWDWGSGRDSTFDPLPACCSNFSLGGNQPLYSQKFKLTPNGSFLLIKKALTACSSKSFWARVKGQQVKVFARELVIRIQSLAPT